MEDGDIEELDNSSAITSIKMLYWYFVNSTSHFSMDFLGKFSS